MSSATTAPPPPIDDSDLSELLVSFERLFDSRAALAAHLQRGWLAMARARNATQHELSVRTNVLPASSTVDFDESKSTWQLHTASDEQQSKSLVGVAGV